MRTRADIKALLISLLPAGSEQLYALENTDNIGGTLYALAGALKDTATDRVEALRREVNPATIVEKIPDWEQACGLSNTALAKFGTPLQRRNAVLSVLREHGSFNLDDIRAAVQPYFLYADPSQIQIVETYQPYLAALHTYANPTPLVLGPSATGSRLVKVLDDPRVSPAGAQVLIGLSGVLDEIGFVLTAPDGRAKVFAPGYLGRGTVAVVAYILYAAEMVGAAIRGTWTLAMTTGPSAGATLTNWSLYVEGLGVNFDNASPPNRIGEGLGAAMFQFGVVADPALLGAGYDLEGAYRAVQKVKPAHTIGVILSKNVLGGICPIPDDPPTIPDRVIAC